VPVPSFGSRSAWAVLAVVALFGCAVSVPTVGAVVISTFASVFGGVLGSEKPKSVVWNT